VSARCIVVGAGVIGANVAFRLVQAGASVTIVDAEGPVAGTSATTFAWVGASAKGLWSYFAINAAGVAAHRRLRGEAGSAPWLRDPGCLQWYSDPAAQEALAERVEELRGVGYPAAPVSRPRAAALEPDAVLGEDVDGVALYPDEGFVFPPVMVAHLLGAARREGLVERYGERVVALDGPGGVALASGERLAADVVVLCCGRWIARLAEGIPMLPGTERGSPVVGLLVRTAPVAMRLERMLYADDTMIRPDGGGRLLLHADGHDLEVDPAAPPSPELADDLVATGARHLAVRGGLRVESAQVGIRALTEDYMPAVGWLPGTDHVYVCVTHSGVTLAALLGELVAAEVLDGADDPLLDPFRPSRFVGRPAPALKEADA
jgi:D-hydroxyproline dehydrogenase subunit beta